MEAEGVGGSGAAGGGSEDFLVEGAVLDDYGRVGRVGGAQLRRYAALGAAGGELTQDAGNGADGSRSGASLRCGGERRAGVLVLLCAPGR